MELLAVMDLLLLRRKKILRRTLAWLAQVRIIGSDPAGEVISEDFFRWREEQPSIEEGRRWRIPGRC